MSHTWNVSNIIAAYISLSWFYVDKTNRRKIWTFTFINFPFITEFSSVIIYFQWICLIENGLIHVDVWQKPTQYCKAIILQLNINTLKKKENGLPVVNRWWKEVNHLEGILTHRYFTTQRFLNFSVTGIDDNNWLFLCKNHL